MNFNSQNSKNPRPQPKPQQKPQSQPRPKPIPPLRRTSNDKIITK